MRKSILPTVLVLFFVVSSFAQNQSERAMENYVNYSKSSDTKLPSNSVKKKKSTETDLAPVVNQDVERKSAIVPHTDLHKTEPGKAWSEMTIQEQINKLQQEIDQYHFQRLNEPVRLQKLEKAVEMKKMEKSIQGMDQ